MSKIKRVDCVQNGDVVIVLLNKPDMYCPVCGEKMVINNYDEDCIFIICDNCCLTRVFEFKDKKINGFYNPVLELKKAF